MRENHGTGAILMPGPTLTHTKKSLVHYAFLSHEGFAHDLVYDDYDHTVSCYRSAPFKSKSSESPDGGAIYGRVSGPIVCFCFKCFPFGLFIQTTPAFSRLYMSSFLVHAADIAKSKYHQKKIESVGKKRFLLRQLININS